MARSRFWIAMGVTILSLIPASGPRAADLYVSGNLLNSFTTGDGSGEIFLGNQGTPLFEIEGSDSDSSPGFGGAIGFGFGIDELRADIRGYEMPHWNVRMELEGIFGRKYDFRHELATQSVSQAPPVNAGNIIFSEIEAWSVMTNVWLDVPVQRPVSWIFGRVPVLYPLSFYVGGGMGLARADFETTDNVSTGSDTVNRFAWQAGGGLGYRLNQWATFQVGYRFFDMGDLETKVLFGQNTLTGTQSIDLTSHEFMSTIRIAFYQAPLEEMAPRRWAAPRLGGWERPSWWRRAQRRWSKWRWKRPRWLGGY